jgi:isoleucyl-tRNA synthetase
MVVKRGAEGIERYDIRPRMELLGPKYKSAAGRLANALKALNPADVARNVAESRNIAVSVDGAEFLVPPTEVEVRREMPPHLLSAQLGGATLVLDTEITPELRDEGAARDTVRHIQQLRKEMDLNIEDRIRLRYATDSVELARAIDTWRRYICAETLSVEMTPASRGQGQFKCVEVDGIELHLQIQKA